MRDSSVLGDPLTIISRAPNKKVLPRPPLLTSSSLPQLNDKKAKYIPYVGHYLCKRTFVPHSSSFILCSNDCYNNGRTSRSSSYPSKSQSYHLLLARSPGFRSRRLSFLRASARDCRYNHNRQWNNGFSRCVEHPPICRPWKYHYARGAPGVLWSNWKKW